MNATLISKEKTAVKLSFEVSAEVLEQGMAFAYNKHKNNLSLPGFRKGKVPRKLIEAQYGEGFFYEDAINHIFPDEYMAAVKELGLDVVSAPTLDIDYIQSGKGAKFICDVTVKPEVELGQYKGLEVEKVSAEVTDEDVMKELEKVQKVEDALKKGDSFADVAKKYSDDGSASDGGYLGYMDSDTSYVDSFKNAAFKLKAKETSDWVKESNDSYNGWHLIKVEETDKAKLEKDKKAKDSLYKAIANGTENLSNTYLWEAAKKLDIKYANDDVKKQIMDILDVKE